MMGAAPAAMALGGLLPLGRTAQAAGGTVNIYSWPDYFATDDLDGVYRQDRHHAEHFDL